MGEWSRGRRNWLIAAARRNAGIFPGQENPGRRSGSLQEHWTGPVGPGVSARPGSVRATVGVTPDPGPKPERSGVGVGRGRLWRLRSSTQTRGTPRFTSSSRLPWGTCTWPPTCRPRTAQARVLRRGRPKLQLLGVLKWQARQLAQLDTVERATV